MSLDSNGLFIYAGVTTGSILFGVLVIAVYQIYSFRKSEEEYQTKVERFLDDYRAMNPTRYSHVDLKKMTNKFRDELGQGAYGTVFKGKLPVRFRWLLRF